MPETSIRVRAYDISEGWRFDVHGGYHHTYRRNTVDQARRALGVLGVDDAHAMDVLMAAQGRECQWVDVATVGAPIGDETPDPATDPRDRTLTVGELVDWINARNAEVCADREHAGGTVNVDLPNGYTTVHYVASHRYLDGQRDTLGELAIWLTRDLS